MQRPGSLGSKIQINIQFSSYGCEIPLRILSLFFFSLYMPSAKTWNLNELTLVLIYRMGYENLILQEPVYLVDVLKMILVARNMGWENQMRWLRQVKILQRAQ